jgi:hypothetical protein
MTLLGIDVSSHQGDFDSAAAEAEGFSFATYKVTEGAGYRDSFWPRARVEMATHLPGRWGGYVFCRTNTDPAIEARVLREHAGPIDFPLQVDYGDTINGGSVDDLCAGSTPTAQSGSASFFLPVYLPRWFWQSRMGSAPLDRVPVGIWNSDYVSGRGYALNLYPGDDWAPVRAVGEPVSWADMDGTPVVILQYTESVLFAR